MNFNKCFHGIYSCWIYIFFLHLFNILKIWTWYIKKNTHQELESEGNGQKKNISCKLKCIWLYLIQMYQYSKKKTNRNYVNNNERIISILISSDHHPCLFHIPLISILRALYHVLLTYLVNNMVNNCGIYIEEEQTCQSKTQ